MSERLTAWEVARSISQWDGETADTLFEALDELTQLRAERDELREVIAFARDYFWQSPSVFRDRWAARLDDAMHPSLAVADALMAAVPEEESV